jgi:hypothetical protein
MSLRVGRGGAIWLGDAGSLFVAAGCAGTLGAGSVDGVDVFDVVGSRARQGVHPATRSTVIRKCADWAERAYFCVGTARIPR